MLILALSRRTEYVHITKLALEESAGWSGEWDKDLIETGNRRMQDTTVDELGRDLRGSNKVARAREN